MKELISVKVPMDSTVYFINSVGCLRYMQDNGRVSSVVEPVEMGVYLTPKEHLIIGISILDNTKIVIIEKL